jgi:hypothetical protein
MEKKRKNVAAIIPLDEFEKTGKQGLILARSG